jgi:hypothetical protein
MKGSGRGLSRAIIPARQPDGVVDIRTVYGLDGPRLESRKEKGFIFLKNRSNRLWSPHSGYTGSFTGAKKPWHKFYHSPVSSAEVKNKWGCTSAPPTGQLHLYLYNPAISLNEFKRNY